MAGGYRYSICFFTCSLLLLFGISLHNVEASNCENIIVIHKKVGDTAELPSCLPTKGVTSASWKYGGILIADKDNKVADEKQFEGRLNLNPTNFSLTIRKLTLEDSGNFIFLSADNVSQRPTVRITLHVHEPIAEQPVLNGNSTWHNLDQSCTVLLECSARTGSSVSYKWTVRNQTISGSRLQYVIKMQDGNTTFTCTAYNFVSEMSESRIMKCSNDTEEMSSSSSIVLFSVGSVIGILLIIPLSLLCYTKLKDRCCNRVTQSQTVNHDETEQHVYSSLLHGDGCVYETVRGSGEAGTGEPDNLYRNITVH
ncbi:signaling lymphocytic activation molecule isoform X4 [Larimichthys crocea]|uniref:signaling lymphocytic activation molecule isoform X4 n=1 Tax=Larimichthys crocea TaxID=215358 RepID=UPI000F604363|nr:signaling lymphocytic activation molecule-like isoform X4 [Larimichthys crocea]